jgi:predicted nucleic acid-binding protein
MRLIDTSAWIEWLIGSPTGKRIGARIPDRAEWLVPTMVQHELAKWLTREIGENKADEVIAFTQTCVIADLTSNIALFAAELCQQHKLATADAIIYATALTYGAELVSCDRHFATLPRVAYFTKKAKDL